MAVAAYTKTIQLKTTSATAYTAVEANTASFNLGGEMLDVTDFTSTGWTSRIRGLKDYSFNLTLFWTTNTEVGTIRDALLNGTNLDLQYLVNGTKGYQGRVLVENFNPSGDVGGVETVDVTLQSNGTALSTV